MNAKTQAERRGDKEKRRQGDNLLFSLSPPLRFFLARPPWRFGVLAFILLSFSSTIQAHPARLASGVAKVDRSGNVSITLTIDLPAFVLNDTPQRVSDSDMGALLDGPEDALASQLADAKDRLLNSTKLKDGLIDSASVPTAQEMKRITGPMRFPMLMEVKLAGHLLPDARVFSIDFPEALGAIVLTVERPDYDPRGFAIEGGEFSPEVPVSQREGEGSRAAGIGGPAEPTSSHSQVGGSLAFRSPSEPSHLSVAWRYVILGFEHILPRGPDHVLFILGLFLLSPKLSPLLWQISAFTIAHSITLGLALYGVVRLPPGFVEPFIAASIAFVAIENLFTPKLHAWRPIVVFVFGLVHGMGFASVLLDMGLPRHDFAPALVAFNVGVELGQLAVVAMALLAVGWFRRRTWYRNAIVIPASVAIAFTGIAWMIQRL